MTDSDISLNLASAFSANSLGQRFSIYLPNKDAHGQSVAQARWVDEGLRLLATMSGGASAMPPIQGAWLNKQTNQLIIEEPIVIYSFVAPGVFAEHLPVLREFMHRLGRETGQGQIAFEFDGTFYLIDIEAPATTT